MYPFLAWLEGSALGHLMRESGVWTYGCVNLAHILSVSTLFGSILVLDLRLLGLWRKVSFPALAEPIVPVAGTGLVIATLTGVCLLATKATEYADNPFFYIKFPAIALGMLNVLALRSQAAWKEREEREPSEQERSRLAWTGGLSLASWLTAITAGRMIGYW